jgi:NodT family efflux transporter outer membrane factor (OMF) lipoprotein
MKRAWAVPLILMLGGCAVGPHYTPPQASVAARFQEASAASSEAPLSQPRPATADVSRWWLRLPDPELHKLIAMALEGNPGLRSATARIRAARQQEIIAGAARLPQVNAMGAIARIHSNSSLLDQGGESGNGASNSSSNAGSTDISLYSAGLDATWETDIFGGVAHAVEAARANSAAALWAKRDGQVSLSAEVAADYLRLRATQARILLLRQSYEDETQTLTLVSARARSGFVTEYDVNQQRSLTATTAAQIPILEADVRVLEHALAVLAGLEPTALTAELDAPTPMPEVPVTLPVGMPSDLLRRRPDIREAERRLAAATASEGAAVAELYPRFNLLGLLSLSSSSFGGLFSTNSLGEIGLGQITWPIFNGGKIRANIRAKHEETQQAYYTYQMAVLKAVQDAEDALVRYKKEQLRLEALRTAVDASRSSRAIALQQYKVGLVSYVNVLSAESQYRAAQDDLVQSRQAFALHMVAVYKALGGGWPDGAAS